MNGDIKNACLNHGSGSVGRGAEMRQPLAIVLVCLLLIPVIFYLMQAKGQAKQETPVASEDTNLYVLPGSNQQQ